MTHHTSQDLARRAVLSSNPGRAPAGGALRGFGITALRWPAMGDALSRCHHGKHSDAPALAGREPASVWLLRAAPTGSVNDYAAYAAAGLLAVIAVLI